MIYCYFYCSIVNLGLKLMEAKFLPDLMQQKFQIAKQFQLPPQADNTLQSIANLCVLNIK
jgi:hypothetical protein